MLKEPKNNHILESLVPIKKAPEVLSISEKTLRNWKSQGRYPQIFNKLGGKVFINIDEVIKIIERQTETAKQTAKRLGLYD